MHFILKSKSGKKYAERRGRAAGSGTAENGKEGITPPSREKFVWASTHLECFRLLCLLSHHNTETGVSQLDACQKRA